MRKPRRKFAAAEQASRSAIVTPRFRVDCLETPEGNGVENASHFHDAGGERFARSSASTKAQRHGSGRGLAKKLGEDIDWLYDVARNGA
jgi:hypothetical protein